MPVADSNQELSDFKLVPFQILHPTEAHISHVEGKVSPADGLLSADKRNLPMLEVMSTRTKD